MPMLTPAQVTHWYLYGRDSLPDNFVGESLIRPPVGPGNPALVLMQDLPSCMTDGPGLFATRAAFGEVTNFFDRVGGNPNNPYVFDGRSGRIVGAAFCRPLPRASCFGSDASESLAVAHQ
jgi:hypothetical protein